MAVSRTDLVLSDRYRLSSLLGTGGMAEVYDAVDTRLERPVAVKLLRPEMAAREDVRLRFEAEARSAARLVHPNVVGVFDSGEDGDVPFLVMERLPGVTLADRMEEAPGALDADWVLRVAGDVLLALGAAHSAGLVHRDVKPANVLIAADGRAKVADFGIAKSLEVAAAADLTSTNQLIGTPAYVAPERILGEAASPQSDLYAVGVLLYEALAGRKPFSGNTPVATAYAIQHATPPPLGELRPDLPGHVVAGVERAMARAPQDRFATAVDFAAALGVAGAADGASTDATVLSTVPAAGSTQILPIVDAVPVADLVDEAPPFAPRPFFEDRRRLLFIAIAATLVALLLLGIAAAVGGNDPPSPRDELAGDLEQAADGLAAPDGSAAGEAAESLRALAGEVRDGAGAPQADELLARLASWRDGDGLNVATADRLAELVRRVPGVNVAAYTPPTTAPPPTEPPRDEKDDDDDKGDGKKKGGKGDD